MTSALDQSEAGIYATPGDQTRHLVTSPTVLVDMWSRAGKSTIVVKRAWLDLETL